MRDDAENDSAPRRDAPTDLDLWLREAVRSRHRMPAPAFEGLWQAAGAAQGQPRRRARRRLRPVPMLTAGALGAAAALAVLLLPPTGTQESVQPGHPVPTQANARPEPQRLPPQARATAAALMRSNLIYARSDALLPPRSLLYASQPAYYLSYDPVAMEVIP